MNDSFQTFYKRKSNKELMARYRTLLVNSGENMDVETEQDDWSNEIYSQKVYEGSVDIAQEIRMECKKIESEMKSRWKEILKGAKR
jgi:hypothetical protein